MNTFSSMLFPCDPLNERTVDPVFREEYAAAREAGLTLSLVDHDRLTSSKEAVFRNLPESGSKLTYRGWMMTVEEYAVLEEALRSKGLSLSTASEQYASAHHLPGWVGAFEGLTPATMVLSTDPSAEEITKAGGSLGSESFIVKDYVKSRKHEWDTACYSKDLESLPRVVSEFIRLQDNYLVGGIVIRAFVPLNKEIPEVRLWWVDGELILPTTHPDFDGEKIPEVPWSFLLSVRERVLSLNLHFITTDIAMNEQGDWIVIEVGDGQVSGLPESKQDMLYLEHK